MRQDEHMSFENLLGGPPDTLLPADPADALLADGTSADQVVRSYPASSLAWAILAESALERGEDVAAYAYARTGYHRGLDALRRHGWKGHGSIPWDHEPNRGFLRALAALAKASESIGDQEEGDRCRHFLTDSSAEAAAHLLTS
jgi:hypothetical protein